MDTDMNRRGCEHSELRPATPRVDLEGSLLVELMIAMSIFAVGVLGLLSVNQSLFRTNQDLSNQDLASTALASAAETLCTTDFLSVYSTYSNRYLSPPPPLAVDPQSATVGRLRDVDGNPARVLVQFDTDETNLPAEYGPIADLDGDDELSTVDVSGSYRVLPARLELSYQTANGMETKRLYIVLSN